MSCKRMFDIKMIFLAERGEGKEQEMNKGEGRGVGRIPSLSRDSPDLEKKKGNRIKEHEACKSTLDLIPPFLERRNRPCIFALFSTSFFFFLFSSLFPYMKNPRLDAKKAREKTKNEKTRK